MLTSLLIALCVLGAAVSESVKRAADDPVCVRDLTIIVGVLFGSQILSDSPESFVGTIFSVIICGLTKSPCDSACVKFMLLAYLHRYLVGS